MTNTSLENNKEQEQIINFIDGPAAVLAGAGSGKTRTLIERLKVLCNKTSPNRIVMLTFTNAAADEMRDRAIASNTNCRGMIVSTYHKYCGMILRKYGEAINIHPNFEILTGMKYTTFIEYIKSKFTDYDDLENFPSASKLQGIFSAIDNRVASIDTLIRDTKYENYDYEISHLYDIVKEEGLKQQKLCFDDMLTYMVLLLSDNTICEKVAKSFDYLMVDEFQDTNELQLDILLKLAKYNKNIVIVGDESQSIYRFRGARVTNIEDFITYFDNCQIFHLHINYRSNQEILDFVNDFMDKNVESWDYTDMEANNKHGSKPKLVCVSSDYRTADYIVNKIKHETILRDTSIIERSSFSSFILENELVKNDIPFVKYGGLKFTEYVCVDEILSFLAVLTNKSDTFNWFNVLKLLPGIGEKTAGSIAEECNTGITQFAKRKFYTNLVELMNKITEFRSLNDLNTTLNEIIKYYTSLRKLKISNMKNNNSKFDAESKLERDLQVLQILKNLAAKYSNIDEFLADIALDSVKTAEEAEDHVIITTIHSAKGLEWKNVYLIDCTDEKMNCEDEEELRCLYVATTRAEDNLQIVFSRQNNVSYCQNHLSSFLADSLQLVTKEMIYE